MKTTSMVRGYLEGIIIHDDLERKRLDELLSMDINDITGEKIIESIYKIFIINENEFLIDNIVFKDNLNKRIDDFIFVIKFKYDNLKKMMFLTEYSKLSYTFFLYLCFSSVFIIDRF